MDTPSLRLLNSPLGKFTLDGYSVSYEYGCGTGEYGNIATLPMPSDHVI